MAIAIYPKLFLIISDRNRITPARTEIDSCLQLSREETESTSRRQWLVQQWIDVDERDLADTWHVQRLTASPAMQSVTQSAGSHLFRFYFPPFDAEQISRSTTAHSAHCSVCCWTGNAARLGAV